MPINPCMRLHHETAKYKAYEVVLDPPTTRSAGLRARAGRRRPGASRRASGRWAR